MHYKTQKSYYKNSIFLFPRKFKQVNFSISRKFTKKLQSHVRVTLREMTLISTNHISP